MFFAIRLGKDQKGRPKAVVVTKVPGGTPGAIQAINKDGTIASDKNGKGIYHMHYDYLEGHIAGIEDKVVEIKGIERTFTNITIHGKAVKMVLSLNKFDRYWVDLMKRLPNADLTRPMRFWPLSITDQESGKTNNLLLIKQDDKTVEMVWNSANNWGNDENGQGGLPTGVQAEDPKTGKMVWSFLKRDRWLDAQVQTPIKAQLEAMAQNNEIPLPESGRGLVEEPQHVEQADNGPDGYTGAGSPPIGDEDDLPF